MRTLLAALCASYTLILALCLSAALLAALVGSLRRVIAYRRRLSDSAFGLHVRREYVNKDVNS